MSICRVLITTECNLKCKYCCNKLVDIKNSFKMTTFDEFIEKSHIYNEINISGGEPILSEDKLGRLLAKLPIVTKTYLYTNGTILPSINVERLDGVNIGIHNNFNYIKTNILSWKVFNKNIRVQCQDIKVTNEIKDFCVHNNIKLVLWTMNECNRTQEDRYII